MWTGRAGIGDLWLAVVDWPAVVEALDTGRLTCSPTAGQVLRVAAGIAKGFPVNLHTCLSTLDKDAVVLVTAALLRATGRRIPVGGGQR